MTPTPPEGFKIIPREWLEAGNPLPEDALCLGSLGLKWYDAIDARGCVTNTPERRYATAQPLPCFSVQSPDQGPEHNPDSLSPAQYGAPEWRLLGPSEAIQEGDEYYSRVCGSWEVTGNAGGNWTPSQTTENLAYRRRVAPAPTPGSTPRTGTVMDCMVGGQEGLNTHPAAEQARNNTLKEDVFAKASRVVTEVQQNTRLAQLRATIETLTRERDEAKAHNAQLQSSYQSIQDTCVAKDQALEKCRAQLEKDRQWQPIETAPRGGMVVFICNEAAYPCSVEAAASHLGKWWHGESVEYDYEPTHWMPLPKSPDAAMKEAK